MNYMGDALLTTPAIAALRQAFPDAQIDTVVGAGTAAEVLRGNPDLNQIIARTARGGASRLISGDSGPMHLAVAVGTPTVAIFGATHPARHGPDGSRNTILHNPVPGLLVPGRRPTEAEGAACMARITPEMVVAAVKAALPTA